MRADESLESACVRVVLGLVGKRARTRGGADEKASASGTASSFDAARCREIVLEQHAKRRKVRGGRVGSVRGVRDADVDDFDEEDEDEDDYARLTEAEVERVLLAMQDAMERELANEERLMSERAEVEYREDEEEQERLTRAIEAFERWKFPEAEDVGENAESSGEDVLCPVCATRRVLHNRHVLFCACGDFRIARADENVGLTYLKRRLAETFEAHVSRGCGNAGGLRFSVRDEYGLDACVAKCERCSFLEIVM